METKALKGMAGSVRQRIRRILYIGVLSITLVFVGLTGVGYCLRVVTNTKYPVAVVSQTSEFPPGECSMSPTLNPGDLYFISGMRADDIKVGDVIIFHNKIRNSLIGHRVIEILNVQGEIIFRTKGDNNPYPDRFLVPASEVLGVWNGVKIPWIGWIYSPLAGVEWYTLLLICFAILWVCDLILRL